MPPALVGHHQIARMAEHLITTPMCLVTQVPLLLQLKEGQSDVRRPNLFNPGWLEDFGVPFGGRLGLSIQCNLHDHRPRPMPSAKWTRGLDWLPGIHSADH